MRVFTEAERKAGQAARQAKGGLARALSMSPRRRKQIARAAAKARWRAAKPQMAVKAKQDV